MLTSRTATLDDLPLLAELNQQLIQDEGHSNPMTLPQLADRMHDWLANREYWAILFCQGEHCVAYALLRDDGEYIYLRHFFVVRECRRQGIGRQAIDLLLTDLDKPIRLEVLSTNERGQQFWRAVGFTDYAITMVHP